MLNTLFLNPPSYNGYDGGAGSRYQCTREVKSFWYPTWLAQLAALVEGSRLIDAPARGITIEDILPLAKEYELENKKLTFHLIKGDSKEKLSILKDKSICGLYNIFPDFVFIDGGHSLATVKSDYEYCKKIPVIVMDDYYTEDEEGKIPPPEHRGVNDIYNDVLGGTKRTGKNQRLIIPSQDRVDGGGYVSLALIVNDPKLSKLPDVHRVPVKVNPRDCVPSDNIQFNVRENLLNHIICLL